MTAKEVLNSNDIYKYDRVWIDGCPETTLVGIDTDIIIQRIKEYTRIKCLEAIRNVRHKACDTITEKHGYQIDEDNLPFILKSIHNIPDQDVMPEL